MDEQNNSVADPGEKSGLELTSREKRLLVELEAIDHRLADMYVGAKMSVIDSKNPEHLRHAAVSVRELIDSLPRYDGRIPTKDEQATLKTNLRRLVDVGRHCIEITEEQIVTPDKPTIKRLTAYTEATRIFIDQYDNSGTKVRDQQKMLILAYDPSHASLPVSDQKAAVKKWMDLDSYFNRVTHENATKQSDFEVKMAEFDDYLLDLLNPPTSQNFDEMDAFIERLEK